jgi:RNA polymerase sigma-70 factor, ECF subfamily
VTPDAGLDEAAWTELYRRLETPLYNAAFRYVWQRQEAQDLVQEAFLQLWQRRAQIEVATVEGWLWTTVLNLSRKRRRWHALRQFLQLDEGGPLHSNEAAPDLALQDAQHAQRLRQAIDALSDKLRRVLLLTEFSGLPQHEVAQLMGIPAGTVASRRHLALQALRAAFTPTTVASPRSRFDD